MRPIVALLLIAACGKSDAPAAKEAEKEPAVDPDPPAKETPRPPPGTGAPGCDKLVAAAKRAEACAALPQTWKDYAKEAVADKLKGLAEGSGSSYRAYVDGLCDQARRNVEKDLAHFKCP